MLLLFDLVRIYQGVPNATAIALLAGCQCTCAFTSFIFL